MHTPHPDPKAGRTLDCFTRLRPAAGLGGLQDSTPGSLDCRGEDRNPSGQPVPKGRGSEAWSREQAFEGTGHPPSSMPEPTYRCVYSLKAELENSGPPCQGGASPTAQLRFTKRHLGAFITLIGPALVSQPASCWGLRDLQGGGLPPPRRQWSWLGTPDLHRLGVPGFFPTRLRDQDTVQK